MQLENSLTGMILILVVLKKSTVDKINEECRLDALKKVAFSESEDGTDGDDDDNDDDDNDINNEKNIKNNEEDHETKEIIIDNKNICNEIMNDLNIVLRKSDNK